MIEKIVALAQRKGVSQAAVERAAGLSENRISKWKNNEGEPTFRQIVRIAEFLDCSVSYLADDSLDAPPPSATLDHDEETALDFYRELVAVVGPAKALRELAKVTAAVTGHAVTVPKPEAVAAGRAPEPTGQRTANVGAAHHDRDHFSGIGSPPKVPSGAAQHVARRNLTDVDAQSARETPATKKKGAK